MKKHYWITTGLILVTIPVVSAVNIRTRNFRTSFVKFSTINIPRSDNESIFDSLQVNQNDKVKGELESVTYFARSENEKEKLIISLNSNTLFGEDYCFMIVSVYSSKGVLDYRLDNTKVEFKGKDNYELEFDKPLDEDETSRHIKVATTFYSNPTSQHQLIEFDVEYTKSKEYEFNENKNYKSSVPVKIVATKEEVQKYYEEFQFINVCDLEYRNPIFDVGEMNFIYNYEKMESNIPSYSECYLLIDQVYDRSDFIEENNMKKIPLELVYKDGVVSFKLKNKYFYDSGTGMVYQNNIAGRNEVSSLILPSTFNANSAVYYELHFKDFSASKSDLVFKSYASFEYKWFGSCDSSLFCVESIDELLEDVHYSDGVTV